MTEHDLQNISDFHFAFPCYNFSLLCKNEKETFPSGAKGPKCDHCTLTGSPFHPQYFEGKLLTEKNVLG